LKQQSLNVAHLRFLASTPSCGSGHALPPAPCALSMSAREECDERRVHSGMAPSRLRPRARFSRRRRRTACTGDSANIGLDHSDTLSAPRAAAVTTTPRSSGSIVRVVRAAAEFRTPCISRALRIRGEPPRGRDRGHHPARRRLGATASGSSAAAAGRPSAD
jgi:hypothetical protein